jgi:hypothetical protein
MSTAGRNEMPDLTRSRWTLPAFSVFLGLVLLGGAAIGHQAGLGVYMFGVMAVFGLAVLLGGKSETVRGLRGDGRDERFQMLDLKATAHAGLAVITAVIAGFVWEIAHGRTGEPYMWLGAIAGLVYLGSVIYQRSRG